MSEIKRYGYLGIVEEEDGEVVKWEDYAALKAQRDALAAENGLAAKAVQTFCDVVGSNTDVIAEEMGIEGAKAILAAMSATGNMPATDAYLNSVRAEAVQKLWNDSLNDVGHMLRDIGAFRDASGAAGIVHDEIKERVEEFAAQLRAGKESV